MKKERKSERITSCGVDQDGKMTVQVGKKELTGCSQVTSVVDLQHVIANPPKPTRHRQQS